MATRVDSRLAECPLVSVQCGRCRGLVSVRKSSWNQTTVQWTAEASARCVERQVAENATAYSSRGVFLACSSLTASIVDAVRHGDVPVVDEMN